MLTTAQQKVKQELEELQLKALAHPQPKIALPHKRNSSNKLIFTIITIILLVISWSLFLKDLWIPKQSGTVSYLTKVLDYNEQSETVLNDVLTGKSGSIGQSRAKQKNLLTKVNQLKTSKSFHEHQQDLSDVIEQRLNIMTSIENTNHLDQLQLDKDLVELRVKQELAADSLIKGFEREKIVYQRKENGIIQYWINSKSYLMKQ
ncbi:hypothetical protein [Neobacillus drentensis]|uniref:hypothetical protein n=1 Tax=Neobacillus drentensis TaxID=220684 RepID=UPI002FFDD4FA